jgi:hypothetical protein
MVEKNRIILIILIILLTLIIIFNSPLDKKIIPARFIFSSKSGFDLTPNQLTFGQVNENQIASRDIKITNDFNKKILVKIKSYGEISEFLTISENNFLLNPGESKNLSFSINPRGLSEYREYSGEVIITSREHEKLKSLLKN